MRQTHCGGLALVSQTGALIGQSLLVAHVEIWNTVGIPGPLPLPVGHVEGSVLPWAVAV